MEVLSPTCERYSVPPLALFREEVEVLSLTCERYSVPPLALFREEVKVEKTNFI